MDMEVNISSITSSNDIIAAFASLVRSCRVRRTLQADNQDCWLLRQSTPTELQGVQHMGYKKPTGVIQM